MVYVKHVSCVNLTLLCAVFFCQFPRPLNAHIIRALRRLEKKKDREGQPPTRTQASLSRVSCPPHASDDARVVGGAVHLVVHQDPAVGFVHRVALVKSNQTIQNRAHGKVRTVMYTKVGSCTLFVLT